MLPFVSYCKAMIYYDLELFCILVIGKYNFYL